MKSLTYIELDVPVCGLTYGVAPCAAQLGFADGTSPVGVTFDGSNDLAKRGAGLTGAADGKLGTLSFWFRRETAPGDEVIFTGVTTLNGGTFRFLVYSDNANKVYIIGADSSGSNVLLVSTSALGLAAWHHILLSFDLSNPAKRHLYVDDVSDLTVTTFVNTNIDYTVADWGLGAYPSGIAKLAGSLADLWFAHDAYIDLSIEANRRLFIASTGAPVYLGATGEIPTGSAPIVYLANPLASWHTNLGTGGGFTLTGTLSAAEFGTGAIKCFNSRKTCQDLDNFDPEDVTLRFAKPAAYLPTDIECIPSIEEVSYTPSTISLGKDLGTRATLSVKFRDHPHSDTGAGFDKYLADRDYDPYKQGTFWGKFRARQPFIRGQALRWITGLVGQDLTDMETRHFVVDSFDGPTPDGKYTLIAKDVLKLADGDRAQAPVLSNGFLAADIDADDVSATLLPSGIGDAEYTSDGYICIGGNEIVLFTRTGDTLALSRGQHGSIASTHKAQDRCQLVLHWIATDPAEIIDTLLTDYADIDSSYIDLTAWAAETSAYLGVLYTAFICEPTSVNTLVSELIEQAALAIWPDDLAQNIRLQVLRGVVTDADTFTPQNTVRNTLTVKEQPDKRVSRVQIYFGRIDPTKPLSNQDNYRSTSLTIDEEAEDEYGSAVIKTIYSRWIPAEGRSIAERAGAVQLARYRDPPRKLTFSTMRYADTDIALGVGYRVQSQSVQDATGAPSNIPIQVTRLNPLPDQFAAEAEEMLFRTPDVDLTERIIFYETALLNANLRATHDSLFPAAQSGDVVTCYVNSGATLGSVSTSLPAFDIGSWPSGVTINVIVTGRIQGRGGSGGNGSGAGSGSDGSTGGTALYTRYPINLTSADAEIWGGGGGGGGGAGQFRNVNGGGGGGGGAGTQPGSGGFGAPAVVAPGADGGAGLPDEAGGGGIGGQGGGGLAAVGGKGGTGGGPGLSGSNGQSSDGGVGGAGGAAGAAIDGVSFINFISTGDIRGGQIN